MFASGNDKNEYYHVTVNAGNRILIKMVTLFHKVTHEQS
jgi:hypothetical protein